MSLDKTSYQGLNAIFGFLNNLDSLVFWISSADFKRQLYVSKAYSKIWGRTSESLQAHPESWLETLNQTDLKNCMPEFERRTKIVSESTIAFRIKNVDGSTRWIKDISYTLNDGNNSPVAIIGVGESIRPEQWQELSNNLKSGKHATTESPFVQDFLSIIKNEYKLTAAINQPELVQSNASFNKKQVISYGDQILTISRRQAECLQYLRQGMSAKQTAKILRLSPRTIEFYLDNLKKKFNCPNKIALIGKIEMLD